MIHTRSKLRLVEVPEPLDSQAHDFTNIWDSRVSWVCGKAYHVAVAQTCAVMPPHIFTRILSLRDICE